MNEICIVKLEEESFRNQPEELLQPQNKAKQHSSWCATHVWSGVGIFIETPPIVVTISTFRILTKIVV